MEIATRTEQRPVSTVMAFSSESSFDVAQRMAVALCNSGNMVPPAFRGEENIGACIVALELSGRIGCSVLAVMQSLNPINGKPSWASTFLIGTVNTCGRFTPLRYRFTGTVGQDDWTCRAVAKDKESGEELVGPPVSIAMAKKEGWYSRAGSKWQTMPESMLTYRAAAFWTRAYAPELSLGMHTAEEVQDMVNITPAPSPTAAFAPREALMPAPDPEPEPQPVTVEAVLVAPEPAPAPAPTQVVTLESIVTEAGFTFAQFKAFADKHYEVEAWDTFDDVPADVAPKLIKARVKMLAGIQAVVEEGGVA
jgi:hypothetical protein